MLYTPQIRQIKRVVFKNSFKYILYIEIEQWYRNYDMCFGIYCCCDVLWNWIYVQISQNKNQNENRTILMLWQCEGVFLAQNRR